MFNTCISDLLEESYNNSDTYEEFVKKIENIININAKEDYKEKYFSLFYENKKVGMMKYNKELNKYRIYDNNNNFIESGTGYFDKNIITNCELDIVKMFGFVDLFKRNNII